jgi:hypothetical protein
MFLLTFNRYCVAENFQQYVTKCISQNEKILQENPDIKSYMIDPNIESGKDIFINHGQLIKTFYFNTEIISIYYHMSYGGLNCRIAKI